MNIYSNFGNINTMIFNMNKLIVSFTIALFLSIGCKSQTAVKDNQQEIVKPGATQNSDKPEHLTKQMFLDKIMDYEKNPDKWIYKGSLPSIIDFYADWCRPCKISSPILDDLAKEYAGKIIVYKINVDEEKELASAFGVQSIPAFLFIPLNDKPVMSAGIAQTQEETKQMFRKQIEEILLLKK
jgi:thioredoxin 1